MQKRRNKERGGTRKVEQKYVFADLSNDGSCCAPLQVVTGQPLMFPPDCFFQGSYGIIIIHFLGALEGSCHVVGCKLRLDSQRDIETPLCMQM